jgi:hypothetical protein
MGHKHDDDDDNDPAARQKELTDLQQGSELFLEIIKTAGQRKLSARAIFSVTTHLMAMLEEFSPYTVGSLIDDSVNVTHNPGFTLVTEKRLREAGFSTKDPCTVCDQRHGFIGDEASDAPNPHSTAN